jgi:glutamate-1-semialdehyde 2,1-aminomutase
VTDAFPADRYAVSRAQHARARRSLARGVATAFRAAQLPVPITFTRGSGARIWDIDGNEYVDFALGFGPLILGHSPLEVLRAVSLQMATGLGYGASHQIEADLAEAVCRTVPSAELCVFNTTGSEAVHAALRIARAATGRTRVVKFLGHYHGWYDSVHLAVPPQLDASSATTGQDPGAAATVTVVPWNDISALEAALGDDVAAVIMEPVSVNAGVIQPAEGYLQAVRDATARAGVVLIFDEVITGYRLSLGGAQGLLGVTPDLTVLGKAVGAGFPLSVVCGRRDILDVVDSGRMAHVGTFNANPVCAAAALATIRILERDAAAIYPGLAARALELASIFSDEPAAEGLAIQTSATVGAIHAFAAPAPVPTYPDTVNQTDAVGFRHFAAALLDQGIHVIPRGLMYVSTAHGDRDMDATRAAVRAAARAVRERQDSTA